MDPRIEICLFACLFGLASEARREGKFAPKFKGRSQSKSSNLSFLRDADQ